MQTRFMMLVLSVFLLFPLSVNAEVSERWQDPPLEKLSKVAPTKKQICDKVHVSTILGTEEGRQFDLRVIVLPDSESQLNILIYGQEGKVKRVAYFLTSATPTGFVQKLIEPSVFERDIFLISFEYAQYLVEESGGQTDPRLSGRQWCILEVTKK